MKDSETSRGAETLASAVYRKLRREIINARFPRGQKLRTQALCKRYGTGLSPIREALNRLAADGLVDQSDQRGFSLGALDKEHLAELTRTRCWLNEMALRESIARGDSAWEENIVLAYHRLSRLPRHLPDHGDNPAWEDAHRVFHSSLIAACGSRWLIRYCEQLFDAADCYRHLSRITHARRKLRKNEHEEIMDAVLARSADKAVKLLLAQFKRTAELATERLAMSGATGRSVNLRG